MLKLHMNNWYVFPLPGRYWSNIIGLRPVNIGYNYYLIVDFSEYPQPSNLFDMKMTAFSWPEDTYVATFLYHASTLESSSKHSY